MLRAAVIIWFFSSVSGIEWSISILGLQDVLIIDSILFESIREGVVIH
jgi:hypothetical protein